MFTNLLLPIDPDETGLAKAALETAAKMAGDNPDAVVRLIAVVPDVPAAAGDYLPANLRMERVGAAEAELADLIAHHGFRHAAAIVKTGSPQSAVLETAKETGTDLIVMSSHKPALSTYILGSTATGIVRHATCSVLVLRGET